MAELHYIDPNKEYSELVTSRYKVLRVVEDQYDTYLETYNQVTVPESVDDIYHVVTHGEVNRLDLIAHKYYRNATMYWAIAIANGFIDPFIVNEGVMLRIPSILVLGDSKYKILSR